jgi:hypothetical protein
MAVQTAKEVDYDYIYSKLEKNNFECDGILEIKCGGYSGDETPNDHICLCHGLRICGTKKGKELLKEAYFSKSIQGKLKAIME